MNQILSYGKTFDTGIRGVMGEFDAIYRHCKTGHFIYLFVLHKPIFDKVHF